MASTLDLLPTILKLVGVEAKKGIALDGYDMGPILFEGKKVRAVMVDYTDLGLCRYIHVLIMNGLNGPVYVHIYNYLHNCRCKLVRPW